MKTLATKLPGIGGLLVAVLLLPGWLIWLVVIAVLLFSFVVRLRR